MFRRSMAAAALAAGIFSGGQALAAVVHTSAFIGTPDYFNGFENVLSDPSVVNDGGAYYFTGQDGYAEGGIFIDHTATGDPWFYVGAEAEPFSQNNPGAEGDHGWGVGTGANQPGYTIIRLESGGAMGAIQFLARGRLTTELNQISYRLMLNGFVVQHGVIPFAPYGDGLTYYGFSNAAFDELHLRSGPGNTVTAPGGDSMSFDSIAALNYTGGGIVPEPSTWALMILGFGAAGAMLRRRAYCVPNV